MPEAVDVTCPCCDAMLKVDPATGAVTWIDEKRGSTRSFDDLVSRAQSRRGILDEKFARSVQQTKHSKEILGKKFEAARKRAADEPDKKPPNPFDYD